MRDQYGGFFYGGDFSMKGIFLWRGFFYGRDFSMKRFFYEGDFSMKDQYGGSI